VNPAPNHYALNQILAQKLHCQHVEYLIGEKIPPDVFEIIWQTNYSESFPTDKYILSINNIFDASQILVKSFQKTIANVNITLNERDKIQTNFLLRLRRVLNLISTADSDDEVKYQSIYTGYLNTYNTLHIKG
jgi:transcriptional regulator NrdR family protein